MSKKKFEDTGFGKFLLGTVKKVPALANTVVKATTNPFGAIGDVVSILKGEDTVEAKEALATVENMRDQWEHELQMYKTEVDDRKDARESFAANRSWLIYVIVLVVCLSFSYMVYSVFSGKMPEGSKEILFHTMGIIEGAFLTILYFYFGSNNK